VQGDHLDHEQLDQDQLDEQQIALVIRRASELDGQAPARRPGLELDVLEQAAVEAGLSRESVRRAVAELRAGALTSPAEAARRSGRAGLGPGTITVSRRVPGPAAEVDGILRRFLQKEQFHIRRDFGTSSTWSRRQDVGARVRIQYDRSIHRRLVLHDAEHVEIAAVEEPGGPGMVMVKLAVDVKPLRRTHRVAVGKGAAGGFVAGTGLLLLNVPVAIVVAPAAAASGVVLGHRIGVTRYRGGVDDLRTAIEGFLDGIERRPGRPAPLS